MRLRTTNIIIQHRTEEKKKKINQRLTSFRLFRRNNSIFNIPIDRFGCVMGTYVQLGAVCNLGIDLRKANEKKQQQPQQRRCTASETEYK